MKRVWIVIAVVSLAAGAWAVYQAAAPAPKPLASFMPPDAQLYLEAKDFGGLLAEWNASPQKASWLKSDNYSAFSRSRLFLRLEDAQKEFTAAAGLPPDMKFAAEVAGQRSAIAIYDIGKLEFVYVTRMPSAKSMQTAIWQLRSKFEPRTVNGVNFYVRTDPESKRVAGFGTTDDYLVLGTREDLIASTMSLLAGQQARNLAASDWYRKTVAAGQKQPGDLRMVLNLAAIAQTPQFRTYWIQQNITDTRQYGSAVIDLYRSSSEYREERALLPASENESSGTDDGAAQGPVTTAGANAVADVLKFAPASSGVYRAFANPASKEALRLAVVKILAPHMGPAPAQKIAPSVALTSGESGNESDLETRIDQAPASRTMSESSTDSLAVQLAEANLLALLQVEETRPAQNGVFVRPHTALVLVAAKDWDGDAVRSAMQQMLQPALTAGQLGVEWVKQGAVYRLSGLVSVVMSTQGKYLFVSDDEPMLNTVVARSTATSRAQPATYAAGFSHATERPNFVQFVDLVDRAPAAGRAQESPNNGEDAAAQGDQPGTREPDFFSKNIASLSTTLKDVSAESVVVRRTGNRVQQTVVYTWSK